MMNKAQLAKILPAGVAVLGILVILVWFFAGHGRELKERLPGADRTGEETAGSDTEAKWEGKLLKGDGVPANLNGVWPGFRGPKGDNISTDPTPLAKNWPEGGPKVLWKLPVGEGYASPAIWKGRVFLMDYDTQAKADALRCLSLADGKEIWRYTYPVKVKRNHGMSRTIPTVTDKCVVAIGPKCHVICVDTQTGELRWKLDLVREFNTEVPPWYAGQCPLVDADRVILGTGGDALVIAVDLMTGKLLWKSPNPRRWQMTHSSLTPAEFKGRRMYVYCASGGVAGVSAADGTILWSTPDWRITMANIPAPLAVGDGRIFLSGGYNAGSMMIQLLDRASQQPVGDSSATTARIKQVTGDQQAANLQKALQQAELQLAKLLQTYGPDHSMVKDAKETQAKLREQLNEAVNSMRKSKEAGGKLAVETLFRLKPTVFGATQQTPILYQNHIIGVRPDGQLACLDLNGKPLWASGAASKFGSGPFMIAQGMIYLLNDHGLLTLAEVSTSGYKQLAQAKILSGVDSWGPLALADGRLIVRDMTEMICLDVSAK